MGAAVDAHGCEFDSDGDGTIDMHDDCPNTPAGASVDGDGCELDTDRDGIVNSKDRCPGTSAGSTVDSVGCLVAGSMVLDGVSFENNSSVLTGSAKSKLDEIASALRAHADSKVEVAGYTDSRGDAGYNKSLSQRRAESVVDYLVSTGVSRSNLSAVGHGEANPVADNSTSAGRAANRRVEFNVQ